MNKFNGDLMSLIGFRKSRSYLSGSNIGLAINNKRKVSKTFSPVHSIGQFKKQIN